MKPVDQSKLSTDENPHAGDCFGACVCSILETDLAAFPDLSAYFEPDQWNEWQRQIDVYLMQHGYVHVDVEFRKDLRDVVVPRGWSIPYGPTVRSADRLHAVVAYDGRVIHDPHPSRAGLTSIQGWTLLVPILMPEQ